MRRKGTISRSTKAKILGSNPNGGALGIALVVMPNPALRAEIGASEGPLRGGSTEVGRSPPRAGFRHVHSLGHSLEGASSGHFRN